MKNMIDKIFGEISYNLFWEGNTSIKWNGNICPTTIIIRSANEQPPSVEQQNCFSYFKDNASVIAIAAEKLLAYCKNNYDNSLTLASIYKELTPKEIIFRKTGRWGITFDSPWEEEKRLAVVFKDGIATAGTDDLLI